MKGSGNGKLPWPVAKDCASGTSAMYPVSHDAHLSPWCRECSHEKQGNLRREASRNAPVEL